MGKTCSDLLKLCAASSSSSPLSNQMDPVVSLTCRSIFPPSPTETQLKCSPPHLYKYDSWLRILGSDKGSPELCPPLPRRLPPPPAAYIALHCSPNSRDATQQGPTAPPDCSQTRLKNDQKTTPTSDPVYLSEKPLLHIRVAKRHSSYTDNKLSLIFDPKKRVICN